jgi:hypothetical protein
MKTTPTFFNRHFNPLCQGLLALLAACCFAGCNWSTTLAVANSGDAKNGSTGDVAPTPDAGPTAEQPTSQQAAVEQPTAEQPADDGRLKAKLTSVDRSQLVGTWKDSFFGTRTLTLNEDGTARMILDLDFAGRLMYGSRLDFDLTWSVEGATVSITILSGKPAKAANSAMKTWGSRYEYLLDCVEDHRIEMRDWDGSMSYILRRVSDGKDADSK